MKTGVIQFILSNVGSKSEKMQPFLKEADGTLVEVYKESDNPFNNETLKPYEGKTVTITGEENEYGLFIIDTIDVVATEVQNTKEGDAAVQLSETEEEPVQKEIPAEPEEKAEEKNVEATTTKEIPEPPLKGFKKFLAFFHRK